jgi:hypothetical protein
MREDTQCMSERLEVSVTLDERRGYIGSAPELRQPAPGGVEAASGVTSGRNR